MKKPGIIMHDTNQCSLSNADARRAPAISRMELNMIRDDNKTLAPISTSKTF